MNHVCLVLCGWWEAYARRFCKNAKGVGELDVGGGNGSFLRLLADMLMMLGNECSSDKRNR